MISCVFSLNRSDYQTIPALACFDSHLADLDYFLNEKPPFLLTQIRFFCVQ
jgi:hypothetical protein